jgi:putative endonuclease
MTATFYILFSPSANKYYVGHTTEPIEERLRKHNANHEGFTGKFQDCRAVYTENYHLKELAYKREREVKKWKSRRMIELLILNTSSF